MVMRYHWGLGIGHTYSHKRATGSENPGTGIAENKADDDGASEADDPVDNPIGGSEAEDQDEDFEGSDSDSGVAVTELDSDDEEIYGMYEDSDA